MKRSFLYPQARAQYGPLCAKIKQETWQAKVQISFKSENQAYQIVQLFVHPRILRLKLSALWGMGFAQFAFKLKNQRKTERLQVISTLDKASASRIRLAMTTK